VIGSTIQLGGIIDLFKEVVHTLTKEVGVNCMSDEKILRLSQFCLSKASRTHSGSIAFQVLQSIIDQSKFSLLPMSTLAHPLILRISLHPRLRRDGNLETVYRCYCECTTIFKVMQIEKSPTIDDLEFLIEVIYLDELDFCEVEVESPVSKSRKVSISSYSNEKVAV
jgi:predicted translin family RNA/ssDNA-binding protein